MQVLTKSAIDYQTKFETGLPYSEFLKTYASPDQKNRWAAVRAQVELDEAQQQLIKGFVREMKIMVSAGAWCGDCVNQCPIFERFAELNEKIQIHYFDRDDHQDLAEVLKTCGGQRVPSVLFLSEDWQVCGRYGDKTLSTYRDLAAKQLGGTCPTGIGGADQSMLNSVTQDWLNEFERIQLMLRLSNRLRQVHGD